MSEPTRVVIAPDVIAWSFFDPDCRAVLEAWSERRIRPVVTRALLTRYIKVLRGLQIPDALLKQWMLWFTSGSSAEFLSGEEECHPSSAVDAALRAQTEIVVFSGLADASHVPAHDDVTCLTAAELLTSL